MADLTELKLAEARAGWPRKNSPPEAHMARAASSALNAYVLETPEKALEMAESDKKIIHRRSADWCESCTKGVHDRVQ